MKNAVIEINDFMFSALVFILAAIGFFIGYGMAEWIGGIIGVFAGCVVGAMLSGAWFVLSGIYSELRLLNSRTGDIRDSLEASK